MATTKIWAVKANLQYTLSYASNSAKTEVERVIDYVLGGKKTVKENLCTGINCDVNTAYEDMQFVKEQFGKRGGILAHHAEQSFAYGEILPEKAHEIGVNFAQEMWGDRFQVLVTTHLDKKHIHNHFVINSVSFVDGKKYNGCRATYKKMRELSDRLCGEEGLSVIKEDLQESGAYYLGKNGRFNLRNYLKNDIDIAISNALSMEDFYCNLRNMGYSLKFGKHFAISPAGKKEYIRLKSFKDDDYTLDGIRKRIAENYNRNYGQLVKPKPIYKKCKRPKQKLTGYMALYYRYLFMLGKVNNKRKPKRIPYKIARQAASLKKISAEVKIIGKYGLKNSDNLKALEGKLNHELEDLGEKRELLRKKVRRMIPEEQKDNLKLEITSLTEKMNNIRKEIRICNGIEIRSKTEISRENKTKEIDKRGAKINEHGRRDGRFNR